MSTENGRRGRHGKYDIPGFTIFRQPDGSIRYYWVASTKGRAAGFQPRTQRFVCDPNEEQDRARVRHVCELLEAEQREWLAGRRSPAATFDTIRAFCDAFSDDRESPINEMRDATKTFYRRYIRLIIESVGKVPIAAITGRDIRGWHRDWRARFGERSAKACIQTLRRVTSYGAGDLADDRAIRLAGILRQLRFPTPAARTMRPTYDLIVAFRAAARSHRQHPRPSMALAITLQYELGLRQRDVIGEWVKEGVDRLWGWGLTWDHIDEEWILRKPTSKSNGRKIALHDLKLYPDLLAMLQVTPLDQRTGAVVTNEETGRPWEIGHFRRRFRSIANAAGWPPNVWSMDARAASVSEALEAGAQLSDVMITHTHTQIATTMKYNRETLAQTRRVATLRLRIRSSPTILSEYNPG